MNLEELLLAEEGADFEGKAARGGLPGSFWETYSAFANTCGGTVVLGLRELERGWEAQGIPDVARVRKTLFDTLNDRGKVSANLLSESDVRDVTVDGKRLLVVRVPEAPRRQKPVFLNNDPLHSTFRRAGEGDYRCDEAAVRRMFAETADARDDRVLRGVGLDDLDDETLRGYRNHFAGVAPRHPWQTLDTLAFLQQLGCWRRDHESGEEGLTLAGMLMFGRYRQLHEALPGYFIDYREANDDEPEVRWTYRLTTDGLWEPNLFSFYTRVIVRLTRDIAIPFRLEGVQRIDDSHVTAALREALINTLIHADHEASAGGIVIVREPDRFTFRNPGDVRVGIEQAYAGGRSDCRNPTLQKLFRLLGLGEQAGSGVQRMARAWEEQSWGLPDLREDIKYYHTALRLSTLSLLPEASVTAVRELYGAECYAALPREQVLAAVTAHVEGQVSRDRLAALTSRHPVDVAVLLWHMEAAGLLVRLQPRRLVFALPESSSPSGAGSAHYAPSSTLLSSSSTHSEASSTLSGDASFETLESRLQQIASATAPGQRLPLELMLETVLKLCSVRPISLPDLAALLHREPRSVREHYLRPLLASRQLTYLYPGEPTHPNQAYRTVEPDDRTG